MNEIVQILKKKLFLQEILNILSKKIIPRNTELFCLLCILNENIINILATLLRSFSSGRIASNSTKKSKVLELTNV